MILRFTHLNGDTIIAVNCESVPVKGQGVSINDIDYEVIAVKWFLHNAEIFATVVDGKIDEVRVLLLPSKS